MKDPLQMDVEQLDKLYEECKDIIHNYHGFNVSREAGELIQKINEIVIIAINHARSKQIVSKN